MERTDDETLVAEAGALNRAYLPKARLEAIDEANRLVSRGKPLTDDLRSALSVSIVRAEFAMHRHGSRTSATPSHKARRDYRTATEKRASRHRKQYAWCQREILAGVEGLDPSHERFMGTVVLGPDSFLTREAANRLVDTMKAIKAQKKANEDGSCNPPERTSA